MGIVRICPLIVPDDPLVFRNAGRFDILSDSLALLFRRPSTTSEPERAVRYWISVTAVTRATMYLYLYHSKQLSSNGVSKFFKEVRKEKRQRVSWIFFVHVCTLN